MFLDDILRLNGRRSPDRAAIVFGEQAITFGQLRDRAFRLANALRTLADPGDRIAILAENLPAYIECYYGVPAAGMVLTFLNYRQHPQEWLWILDDARATTLIVQAKYLGAVRPVLAAHANRIRHIVVIDDDTPPDEATLAGIVRYEDLLRGAPAVAPDRDFGEATAAWLLYTSGTTGHPKGAILTHRSISASVLQQVIEFQPDPDERRLISFPLCHVSGTTVLAIHLRGGRVVLAPAFAPEQWMQLVERHQITDASLAPTMLSMVMQHPAARDYKLESLRAIGYGSAAMPVEVLRTVIERFGPIVYSGFGMTELSGGATILPKDVLVRAIHGSPHILASCGRPMCLVDAMIVDENMVECPVGVPGEMVIRGDQVFAGYTSTHGENEVAFSGDWFHTGDVARRDEEGYLYIVDRLKDMIVSGGENVYGREVEDVLYTHPGVSEAAVIGLPDQKWGESVTAVIVLIGNAKVSEADIVALTRSRIAGYKQPRQVIFVDELPKTVTGKIQKQELRRRIMSTL